MTRVIRALGAIVSAALLLVLAACAGLPTTGPVNPGIAPGEEPPPPDFFYIPEGPQPGASPEEIVRGFVEAGTGPADNWATARLFLSTSLAEVWDPTAGVTVDERGDRTYAEPSATQVSLMLEADATVNDSGAYETGASGLTTLEFRLAQRDDGEWRITEAPDGIVLGADQFPNVYGEYSLMYFDPTWTYLVPDVRWFPTVNAATWIADALVAGAPSPWLAEAVRSAVPESVTLSRPSVPVTGGVADVDLSRSALGLEQDGLDRLYTQLQASLVGTGVTEVRLTADSTPLAAEAVPVRSTRVATAPLVLTAEGFGFLSGDDLTPIDGLSAAMTQVDPAVIQVGVDRDVAAVLTTGGETVRVESDGDLLVVDDRDGLIAPTVDPAGFVWSVPRDGPAGVLATGPDGVALTVAGAFPESTEIAAFAVSRDGARLAAIVSANGRLGIEIAGVVRDADGVPIRLTDPLRLGPVGGAGLSLAWLDDTTVAAVSRSGTDITLVEQPVGGAGVSLTAPTGTVSVSGANTDATVRLLSDDGLLFVRRAANWEQTADGILVLATQQGSPE
ncbi:LpqB family beta-propeller domain-containing protein [Microbacterium xanthum]|uniref:LpqB family beta-propeller domain-containing protein n=1 Tax=Microbacterium xanthum TaxID=3079794 RepID=UPI002AD46D3B|nr:MULTISPECIES: LpqB family beta-propeller domain-containing protein [unclassified Microbacterium]MDZ8171092.1 LpqB family beta-propeller domain-containing protein [Microbacterium sp. KSW-48]MDZ8201609.1 LpqB family beta-propeller domain-containing protein [Microbacterium sp. SSW1-59]